MLSKEFSSLKALGRRIDFLQHRRRAVFPVQQLVLTSFEGTSRATQSCMLGKQKSVTWGTRPFPAETRPLSLFTGSQMAKVRCCICYRTLKCCLCQMLPVRDHQYTHNITMYLNRTKNTKMLLDRRTSVRGAGRNNSRLLLHLLKSLPGWRWRL